MPEAIFAAVFVIFLAKIVLRYAWHAEPAWSDEICVILFIWMIFWANALVVPDRQQICFDLLYRPMPPPVRRVMALLRHLLIGGSFAAGLPAVLDYLRFLHRESTPVLEWRLDAVYSCFALFAVAVVLRALLAVVRLLGPGWRDAV
jgi:TRAP-type C4-dicarboxylate transport system permease small subunit